MHYLDPKLTNAHVVILYRNFLHKKPHHFCHVGLGVNALHTCKVLRRQQIRADPFGVWTAQDVHDILKKTPTVTHAVIEAPWLGTTQVNELLQTFPQVHFLIRAHSEVGFLQVEPGAITLLREQVHLAELNLNLNIASNSRRLSDFFRLTYQAHVLYLPNLYDTMRVSRKPALTHDHKLLRIGSFGALRWLKNHTTSAAAAMSIAKQRNCDLEFWISVDREEHGSSVLQSVRNMVNGVPWAKLVENHWQTWAEFRRTIATMDLTMQPSFTETFNIVTADSVTEGVPAVVSHSVEWVPEAWKCDPDNVADMTRVGQMLLQNPHSAEQGFKALETYVNNGIILWTQYLSGDPSGTMPGPRVHQ